MMCALSRSVTGSHRCLRPMLWTEETNPSLRYVVRIWDAEGVCHTLVICPFPTDGAHLDILNACAGKTLYDPGCVFQSPNKVISGVGDACRTAVVNANWTGIGVEARVVHALVIAFHPCWHCHCCKRQCGLPASCASKHTAASASIALQLFVRWFTWKFMDHVLKHLDCGISYID